MALLLSVKDEQSSVIQVQYLTENLCKTLQSELGVDSELKKESTVPNAKGEPITVGTILIALIKSGAVVGFINAVKACLLRSKTTSIQLERSDGEKMEFTFENMSSEHIDRTLRTTKEFLMKQDE